MNRRTFLGYLFSGGSAAVVDLGLFLLLVAHGLTIPVAALGSFAVAMVWNYVISAHLVFTQPLTARGFALFCAVAVAGAGVNSTVTWFAATQGVIPALAKVLGIGTAFFLNYAANSLIVFRRTGSTGGGNAP